MKRRRTVKRRGSFNQALDALLQGDEGQALFRMAYAMCGNDLEAAELVAEACYRALRARSRFDPSRSLNAWLYRIMRNAFLDLRRRAAVLRTVSLFAALQGELTLAEVLADPAAPMLDVLEATEAREALAKALAQLPRHHRRVVELFILGRLSCKDTAKVLRISVGTVWSRLNRARKALGKDADLGALLSVDEGGGHVGR